MVPIITPKVTMLSLLCRYVQKCFTLVYMKETNSTVCVEKEKGGKELGMKLKHIPNVKRDTVKFVFLKMQHFKPLIMLA